MPRSKQALSQRLQVQLAPTKLAQMLDSLVRVPRRVERDLTKRVQVETFALRENAVTQEYRFERECFQGPSMPASLGVPLEFYRSFVFWLEGPCFAIHKDCSSNAS